MKQSDFLTAIGIIAEKHDCRIIAIDLDTHTVKMEGPQEGQLAWATEIATFIESIPDVLEADELDETIKPIKPGMSWVV